LRDGRDLGMRYEVGALELKDIFFFGRSCIAFYNFGGGFYAAKKLDSH